MPKLLAALSLGGNLGDVEDSFRRALKGLAAGGLESSRASSIYKTAPVGCEPGAPDFLNMAITGLWGGAPEELLSLCKHLEAQSGRPPEHPHWVSRTLDIDIVCLGGVKMRTETLEIPHPEALKRAFVIVPLAEIAPDLRIPSSSLTMQELANSLLTKTGTINSPPLR